MKFPFRNIRHYSRTLFLVLGTISLLYFISLLSHHSNNNLPYGTQFVVDLKPPNYIGKSIDLEGTTSKVEEGSKDEWNLEEENIPGLDLLLVDDKKGPKQFNGSCAKFPDLYTIEFSNSKWQVQQTDNETYYLYNAYLDLRLSNESVLPAKNTFVRVLGMVDYGSLKENNASIKHCQFWYKGKSQPVFAKVTDLRMTWVQKWGKTEHYYPYLITCALPPNIKEVPASVSIVSYICESATNNLKILHQNRLEASSRIPKRKFGICVKALDYPDGYMLSRLVEWIEIQRLLGVAKIFFYEYFVDAGIKKVLQYYGSQGVVQLSETTLPGDLPNQPQIRHLYINKKKTDKRLTELIPYNDCLYKNMYDYEYLAVMDTDEVIMPSEPMGWPKLIEIVNEKDIGLKKLAKGPMSTYCFRNYYFMDNMTDTSDPVIAQIPPEFHMLQHIYRSSNNTGMGFMKCFHSTQDTLGVHNHFAFYCVHGKCKRHYVDVKRAQMNHYREHCVKDIKNCTERYGTMTEIDTKIWRYKDELIERLNSVLKMVE